MILLQRRCSNTRKQTPATRMEITWNGLAHKLNKHYHSHYESRSTCNELCAAMLDRGSLGEGIN